MTTSGQNIEHVRTIFNVLWGLSSCLLFRFVGVSAAESAQFVDNSKTLNCRRRSGIVCDMNAGLKLFCVGVKGYDTI